MPADASGLTVTAILATLAGMNYVQPISKPPSVPIRTTVANVRKATVMNRMGASSARPAADMALN